MVTNIIRYFEDCITDIEYDIVNKQGGTLLTDNNEYINRYNRYIKILKQIDNSINKNHVIKQLIDDFNDRIDTKNERLSSGVFINETLFIEYINSNKDRYQKLLIF